MRERLRQTLGEWHRRHHAGDHWLEFLEVFIMTVADLDGKLDAIRAGVEGLKAEITVLKSSPALITQAELDALNAKADAIINTIAS
jgi:hypothetical protein